MMIISETSITHFQFWGGAKDTVKYLTPDEMQQLEEIIEELYPNGITDTELNDLFWFQEDTIAEWLGYESFEKIMEREN